MQNRVTVLLTATDAITPVVSGLKGAISSALAPIAAMAAGIAAATVSFNALQTGIQSAASIQTSMLADAGDVAELMGTSYSKALSTVKEVRAELTKVAAALPGQTEGFTAIGNAVSSAIAQGAGGDVKKYKDDLIEVSKVLGFLAARKNVDMNLAASASGKFISGSSSLTELFASNDIFEKNKLFRDYLKEQLKSIGKTEKDWQTLTAAVRIQVIRQAGKKALSQDTIDRLTNTTDSLLQEIQTNLFNQDVGLFGFLRSVKELNGRTGLDAFYGALKSFKGMMETIGKVLEKRGLNLDPMVYIGKTFDFFGDLFDGLNQFFSGQGGGNLKKLFGKINLPELAQGAADGLSSVLKEVGQFLKTKDMAKLGESFVRTINQALSNFIFNIDWRSLGEILWKGIEFLWGMLVGQVKLLAEKFIQNMTDFTNILPKIPAIDTSKMNSVWDIFKPETWQNTTPPNTTVIPDKNSQSALPMSLPSINGNTTQNMAFSPVIQVSGVSADPQQLADTILAAINNKYLEYRMGVIA